MTTETTELFAAPLAAEAEHREGSTTAREVQQAWGRRAEELACGGMNWWNHTVYASRREAHWRARARRERLANGRDTARVVMELLVDAARHLRETINFAVGFVVFLWDYRRGKNH